MEQEKKEVLGKDEHSIEKEKTMDVSIKEGSATSVMMGLTTDYITPYALALNANNAQIGFLNSFSGLIPAAGQVYGSKLMEKKKRKKILIEFVALQAFMWLPIALLSLLFWRDIFTAYLPAILIVFYVLYATFGSIAGPAWFSLIGDIVPEKIRGRYFGNRNRICGFLTIIAAVLASFILDFFKTKGYILIGFSILFVLAFIFRAVSVLFLKKHYDPEIKLQDGYYFSFWQFIKKAPTNNYGKFVIFVALTYFGVTIAGPFFAVYMLKDLGFSFTTYMMINISASVFSLLFMPIWGKFSDKYGNKKLMGIGAIAIAFIPLFWLFSSSPIYLVLVPQLLSGVGWAAFNLAAGNYIYDCVTVPRRGICVAYYNLVIGIGIFLGSSLGGLLAQYITISIMNKFYFIFLISAVVRLVSAVVFLPMLKEVRTVEPASTLSSLKETAAISVQGIVDGTWIRNLDPRRILGKFKL